MDTITRSNNRLELVRNAAAELFASKGYRETTTRDIAAASGMLPGSIYYHFPNKDALLIAVYKEGTRRLAERVHSALEEVEDPWDRLVALLTAHLETILDRSAYARVIVRVQPDSAPRIAAELTSLRDKYEAGIRDVVKALPLPSDADRGLLRLFVIGAANHAQIWYRPGGHRSPMQIAQHLAKLYRSGAAGV